MLPPEAIDYWSEQQRLSASTLAVLRRLWRRMGGRFDASWAEISDLILLTVLQAQEQSASLAVEFVPAALGALNFDDNPDGEVAPESLIGVAGDGRPVESLLLGAKIAAKRAVADGADESQALTVGGKWLDLTVKTLLSDTGRAAESIGVAARPGVGYVRMLNPPSCSRCVVLAGKFYRYKAGFRRHPGCDCRHIPSRESVAGDLTVDPQRYFDSLSKEAQDKTFTTAGAEAIRDGADITQVVNVRRGMSTAQTNLSGWIPKGQLEPRTVYGQRVFTSDEGATRRGIAYRAMSRAGYAHRQTDVRSGQYFQARAPRLMPESIYQLAEDRADALRLLKLYGYLTH